jgi:hypothetical protein
MMQIADRRSPPPTEDCGSAMISDDEPIFGHYILETSTHPLLPFSFFWYWIPVLFLQGCV